MPQASTVLGPVDTGELGFTLSHEHIATVSAGMRLTYPEFFDRQWTIEFSRVTECHWAPFGVAVS